MDNFNLTAMQELHTRYILNLYMFTVGMHSLLQCYQQIITLYYMAYMFVGDITHALIG